MGPYHLDNDFLVIALTTSGPERRYLLELASSGTEIAMSAIAWYEFQRGPRTAEHVAVAESFLAPAGVIPFSREIADVAGQLFRRLKKPRKRVADLAIAATALAHGATLVTRNAVDFSDILGLKVVDPRT